MWNLFVKNLLGWYEGEFVPYENDPSSKLVFIGGHQRQHWTSRLTHIVIEFGKANWKWIIGTTIAIFGIYVAA